MTKFAVFVVVSVAGPTTRLQQHQVQQQQQLIQGQLLANQIVQVSNGAASALQNTQIESYQGRLSLIQQANDYAYYVQNVIYHLQQGFQNYQPQQQLIVQQQGQGQQQTQQYIQQYQYLQQLQQVLTSLAQNSYSVQQAINGQNNQVTLLQAIQHGNQQQLNQQGNLQQINIEQVNQQQLVQSLASQLIYVLQANLQGVAAQAQQLAQLVLQYQQCQNYQYYINYEILGALGELLGVTQRIQVQGQVQTGTPQEYNVQIQTASNQIVSVIQNVNGDYQQTAQTLGQYAQQQSQIIGLIINRLQRQIVLNSQCTSINVIQQVANKLSGIRSALDQAASYQGTTQAQVTELRNQLRINASGVAAQIERLVGVAQSNQSNRDKKRQTLENYNDNFEISRNTTVEPPGHGCTWRRSNCCS